MTSMKRTATEAARELNASDPLRHCFREDSPTSACRSCGWPAEKHEGCDCEGDS